MSSQPRISIVTPSYNQGKFLEKTILSVLEQGYPNLEYIIIDGCSTDDSVETIKKYGQRLTYWVSEPDRGQSHAINKGFERATGEIFGWLNSDDWYHPGALKAVAEAFVANSEAGAVVGAGDYVAEDGTIITSTYREKIDLEALYSWYDNYFWQPSCFFTSTAWQQSEGLDESLQLCMDYDLWIKIAKKFRFVTTPQNLSATLLHTDSKTFQGSHKADLLTLKLVMQHGGMRAFEIIMESYHKRLISFDIAVQDRENEIECLRRESECLRQEGEALHGRIAELNAIHQNLLQSYSWKLTAPLRRTLDIVKGIKG